MKFLCLADIHGDREAVEKLKEFARVREIENILILGDFPAHGNFNSIKDGKFVLATLREFNLMVIPGNCDSRELIPLLQEQGVSLHDAVKFLPGTEIKIAGFGGSSPTPSNTPLEFEEDYLYEKLSQLLTSGINKEKFILATHVPPKDTNCDLTSSGEHIGSLAVRKIVEEFQPSLVLSSHVHEAAGKKDKIGKSTIANIGKLGEGHLGIIEIVNGEITLELTKFL